MSLLGAYGPKESYSTKRRGHLPRRPTRHSCQWERIRPARLCLYFPLVAYSFVFSILTLPTRESTYRASCSPVAVRQITIALEYATARY